MGFSGTTVGGKQSTGRPRFDHDDANSEVVILDPRHLGAAKMKQAAAFFAAMKSKELKPAYKMREDDVRTELDNFILKELLGVGAAFREMSLMTALVRKKLSLEPSFNGGK
jgi:hypothetical protein